MRVESILAVKLECLMQNICFRKVRANKGRVLMCSFVALVIPSHVVCAPSDTGNGIKEGRIF